VAAVIFNDIFMSKRIRASAIYIRMYEIHWASVRDPAVHWRTVARGAIIDKGKQDGIIG